jgi:hypothetical protein
VGAAVVFAVAVAGRTTGVCAPWAFVVAIVAVGDADVDADADADAIAGGSVGAAEAVVVTAAATDVMPDASGGGCALVAGFPFAREKTTRPAPTVPRSASPATTKRNGLRLA